MREGVCEREVNLGGREEEREREGSWREKTERQETNSSGMGQASVPETSIQ